MNRDRLLTCGEWASMSPGLARALRLAGAEPRLRRGAHPAARVAALWRGRIPILTRGDLIFWPDAPADLSMERTEAGLATLQHELQHVLDYATGWLTAAKYLCHPRHWTYRWRVGAGCSWDGLGAEQRASIAERFWRVERSGASSEELTALRRLVPWARGAASTRGERG